MLLKLILQRIAAMLGLRPWARIVPWDGAGRYCDVMVSLNSAGKPVWSLPNGLEVRIPKRLFRDPPRRSGNARCHP